MPIYLNDQDPDFEASFEAFLDLKRDSDARVDDVVREIIGQVRTRKLDAVLEYTRKFDDLTLTSETVEMSNAEIASHANSVSSEERRALDCAAERIHAYHAKQVPDDARWTDDAGVQLGWKWSAIDTAGIYVPGGLASYPSSVLMNAVPARAAGVSRVVMAVPTPNGAVNPLVMLAAQICGVESVFRIGGAQAIAAMAYGAGPIPRVDKITGPGNAYVAAAKRQVFGQVGIDMVAGPSEVLILADADANPEWVALDLLAQAEHDASAQSILITDSADLATAVEREVSRLLQKLKRRDVAARSWAAFGSIIQVSDIPSAIALANRIAAEHLEIQTANAEDVAARIRHAGAIFLGSYTPEAIGDYVGGPNHVLPTAGSARFSSGLSVLDFMKRTTISQVSPGALRAIGPGAAVLARSESLEAHALSVEARLESLN